MKLTPETAKNMNQGFSLIHTALSLLKRIDQSLLQLARESQSRADNALAEGATPGSVAIGAAGITQTGWNGPNVIDPNPERRGSNWTNTSQTQTITLGLGVRQPTAGAGIVLAPGQSWDGRISGMVWKGSVSAVASGAGATLAFVEV